MILVVYTPFFYDGLAGKLNLTSYGGFPMNNFFALKSGTVIDLSASRSGSVGLGDGKPIPSAEESGLLDLCAEHYSKFKRSEKKTPNVLMVTHPWYRFLSMWATTVEKGREKQAVRYMEKMLGAFSAISLGSKFRTVIFELPEHYASITGTLLEKGLVDEVAFTQEGNGHINTKQSIAPTADAFYAAGSYVGDGMCVHHSLSDVWIENLDSRLILVPDLTLPHPILDLHSVNGEIPSEFAGIEDIEKDQAWLKRLKEIKKSVHHVVSLDDLIKLAA